MDLTPLLTVIGSNGPLGAAIVILCVVLYRIFTLYLQVQTMLLAEKDKHRENVEKITNEYTTVTTAYQRALDILSARLSGPKEKNE